MLAGLFALFAVAAADSSACTGDTCADSADAQKWKQFISWLESNGVVGASNFLLAEFQFGRGVGSKVGVNVDEPIMILPKRLCITVDTALQTPFGSQLQGFKDGKLLSKAPPSHDSSPCVLPRNIAPHVVFGKQNFRVLRCRCFLVGRWSFQ